MFSILLSALFTVVGWLVKSVLVKFVVFFALFFITTEFTEVIVSALLPSSDSVFRSFATLPPSMMYFMDVFQVPAGLSMVFSACVTRFAIRRIPIIG